MLRLLNATGRALIIFFMVTGRLWAWEPSTRWDTSQVNVDPTGEIKIFSDLLIPEGEVRSGSLRLVGGNLTVAGKVTGRITVLGGEVRLLPTAEVEGSIFALGGRIVRHPDAIVTGQVVEVNRGKVSLSRKQAKEIFGEETSLDWSRDQVDWDDDDWKDQDDWRHYRHHGHRRHGWQGWEFRGGYSRVHPDLGVPEDVVLRYNRSEGVALYVPFDPGTEGIPGLTVRGFLGYAFGPSRWYGRLAIGEYLFNKRLALVVEGHREPQNDDIWRVTPTENFLGALLIHEDWYDWYQTEGVSGSVIMNGPWLSKLRIQYLSETHNGLANTAKWSLFGGDKQFREAWSITEGKDVNLSVGLALGRPVGLFHRKLAISTDLGYTQSVEGSSFDYTRQDVAFETFLPLHYLIGIRVSGRAGSVLSDRVDGFGPQHSTPLGGIGSVGGYRYKSFDPGNHYGLLRVAITMLSGDRDNVYRLSWHYGNNWSSSNSMLSGDFINEIQDGGRHSAGIGIGDEDGDFLLEIYKPLTGVQGTSSDWTLYLRLLDF
ncbi:MAG: polymer-forming cytoskeletal protein [Candidatus Marinimicrobia bacterium]|nr:polymer-forming cytoskeletal protein [Candidatus Neomarinimicrobiota bacterium]